jgi:hypothetical protein
MRIESNIGYKINNYQLVFDCWDPEEFKRGNIEGDNN